VVSEASGDASEGEGLAEGIDLEGRLMVRLTGGKDDGILARWAAGEVHLAR
jgi:hypothetical protein